APPSLRVRNLTRTPRGVTLPPPLPEAPPAGQANIVTAPPLIIRSDFNATNLVYGYSNLPLGAVRSWTLAPANSPGSEIEVVIGLNRSAITTASGALLGRFLRFNDGFGFSQVDIGVSATAASNSGLWVGNAVVTQVGQYLKSYSRDSSNNPVVLPSGNYLVNNIDTSLGEAIRPYPL